MKVEKLIERVLFEDNRYKDKKNITDIAFYQIDMM